MPGTRTLLRASASARPLVTVLTVAVGLQCLRVLFPVAYSYREANGIPKTVLAAAVVFLAPALAPVLVRMLRPGPALLGTTAALVVARVAVQAVDPVGIVLATATAAIGIVAIGVVLAPTPDGRTPALAVLGGLALDTALRAAFGTWDLAWQHDATAWTVTALLLGALALAAASAARDGLAAPHADRTWLALATGPYLALQVLFLQNVAAVAAAGRASLAVATAVVLLGDGLAALAVLAITGRDLPRGALVAATVATAVVVVALPSATHTGMVALVVTGQVLGSVLFARAAAAAPGPVRTRRACIGAAAGGTVLGLTLFLYQIHYDRPLPVDNRWLLVGAAAVLGAAALLARPAEEPRTRPTRATWAVAGALGLLAAAVVAGIALGAPGPVGSDHRTRAAGALRVATFNVHNAVTRDGQVDLEAIAQQVEAIDPDVLVVEEADRGWLLAGTADVGEWLHRRLDMTYAWAPAADQQMGNLVLSRLPLDDTRVVALPRGTGTMRRSALITTVEPRAGHPVTVVGVHFQNGSSAAHQDTRIRETDTLLDAWAGAPRTVLLGDFNMDPGERELRHLLDAGFTTTQSTDRCALKTSNDNCVDWILVTDDLVQSAVRAPHSPQFDHNPVVATVRPR